MNLSFHYLTSTALATLKTGNAITAGRIYFVYDRKAIVRGTGANTYEVYYEGGVGSDITWSPTARTLTYKTPWDVTKTVDMSDIRVGVGTGVISLVDGLSQMYTGIPDKSDTIAIALARVYNNFEDAGSDAALALMHAETITGSIHGSTTVGGNLLRLANPGAISFLRVNANNTVSALSASDFRTAIGAGTSSTVGTVTSVSLSAPTGFAVTGSPVTISGTLALSFASGYSLPTTASQTAWTNHLGATGSAHGLASTSVHGFMSSTDKSKLDGVATNANNYSHPTGDGNLHVPVTGTGSNGKFLMAGATAGVISWTTITKSTVGLGNVTNESKATMFTNAALTGAPTAPTANVGTNNTQIANTIFVNTAIGNAMASVFKYQGNITPAALDALTAGSVSVGFAYRISAAGANVVAVGGEDLEVGDLVICATNSPSLTWTVVQNNIEVEGLIFTGGDAHLGSSFANGVFTLSHLGNDASSTAAAQTLTFGGTFAAISALSNSKGHVTGYTTRTFTMPSQTTLSVASNTDASKVVTNITVSNHAITPAYNTLSSRLMTGYSKSADVGSIAAADTLTTAFSRIENNLDIIDTALTWIVA